MARPLTAVSRMKFPRRDERIVTEQRTEYQVKTDVNRPDGDLCDDHFSRIPQHIPQE